MFLRTPLRSAGALAPGVKRPGREADYSPPSIKGKVVPVLKKAPRHEGVSGSGGIDPRIP
jgi:hypothetical protein